ncbi:YwpF family protein [Sporosarcina thermotolerans]|uniref:YwpF family protein n=1 Tax=Sporosarcina thermotolerans TaxID=633404 RepID=A0AAW9A628_9BACL|nr:YwpF family protein [Sporosarcina thermotolerans]MDW0116360.1 YwpF family protein [Sporosarcina thermotolerans]
MKTFKMLSVGVLIDDKIQDFPLIDGIIINQENSHRMWILEMFIDKQHEELFQGWKDSGEVLDTSVVISYPENEPAGFRVAVDTVQQIGDNISVLMKGRLKRARTQYAEHLLEELITEGLFGEDLLRRFESDMRERPRLKKDREKED